MAGTRTVTRLLRHVPKLLRISALLILALLLTRSGTYWKFTTTPQAPLGEWIFPSLTYHYLGRPIEATLRFTGPMGVYITPSSLPCEGETVGPFEVRKRTSRIYNAGGIQITEFRYSLQYLFPLSKGVFTGQALREVKFEYRYRYHYKWHRLTGWLDNKATTWPVKVYLLRRTRPGDSPFPTVGKVVEPFTFGVVLKIAGGLILGSVLLFHLGKMVNAVYMKKKRRRLELAEIARPCRELLTLWSRWVETKEYVLFLKAAIIARDLEKKHLGLPPGGLLPRLEFWLVTTVTLYSGRPLSPSRVDKAFRLFLRRFPVQENAMLFVLGS